MVLGLAMLAGCQAQSKPAAGTITPNVLNVASQPTQHRPSVYAMPAVAPASSAAAAGSVGVPAYLPPEGSTTSAPPVGLVASQQPQIDHAQPASTRIAALKARKAQGKTYLVKRGDTLFQIARDQCGSGSKWRQISALNPGLTPANLKAGQKLLMP